MPAVHIDRTTPHSWTPTTIMNCFQTPQSQRYCYQCSHGHLHILLPVQRVVGGREYDPRVEQRWRSELHAHATPMTHCMESDHTGNVHMQDADAADVPTDTFTFNNLQEDTKPSTDQRTLLSSEGDVQVQDGALLTTSQFEHALAQM